MNDVVTSGIQRTALEEKNGYRYTRSGEYKILAEVADSNKILAKFP